MDYKQQEINQHVRALQEIESSPVQDKKEGYSELCELLHSEGGQDWLIEKFNWFITGDYGAGAYYRFWDIEAKPRTRVIMGFVELCILEFRTSAYYVRRALKNNIEDLEGLNRRLMAEMEDAKNEEEDLCI